MEPSSRYRATVRRLRAAAPSPTTTITRIIPAHNMSVAFLGELGVGPLGADTVDHQIDLLVVEGDVAGDPERLGERVAVPPHQVIVGLALDRQGVVLGGALVGAL